MAESASAVTKSCVAELRHVFTNAHGKIVHCVDQLSDDQLNWRPFEAQNSIANVILHLCGNLRQWIVAGLGGAPDERNRPAEFSEGPVPKEELVRNLAAVVEGDDFERVASLNAVPVADGGFHRIPPNRDAAMLPAPFRESL